MNSEQLIIVTQGLARPIGAERRNRIITDLRNTPSDIDGARTIPWKKGSIFFLSLQDLSLVSMSHPDLFTKREYRDLVKGAQACFVKDLDFYLAGFPPEETEMQKLFQTVYKTGTSTYWHSDRPFAEALRVVYWDLSEKAIRPWTAM